jgi:hypothetical protein
MPNFGLIQLGTSLGTLMAAWVLAEYGLIRIHLALHALLAILLALLPLLSETGSLLDSLSLPAAVGVAVPLLGRLLAGRFSPQERRKIFYH